MRASGVLKLQGSLSPITFKLHLESKLIKVSVSSSTQPLRHGNAVEFGVYLRFTFVLLGISKASC